MQKHLSDGTFGRVLQCENINNKKIYALKVILPIKKYGKHSALNMFTEYSMTSPKGLAEYVGFTKEDVLEICRQKNLNYDLLKEWYDGYRISNKPSDELTAPDFTKAVKRIK